MKQTLFSVTGSILAFLAIGSCNNDPVGPEGCRNTVQVAVSGGTSPLFSWSPPCGMSALSVETVPPAPAGLMWSFSLPESAPIPPDVRYGAAPRGATVSQPKPLIAGQTYRVRIVHTLGGDGLLGTGEATFTP